MSIFKSKKLPTIAGIVTLIVGIGLGVMLIKSKQIFRLGASEEISPKNLRISNIGDTSFSISWTTNTETKGFIKWGVNASSLRETVLDQNIKNNKNHYITISGLSANSQYFFAINSQGIDYDNSGVPWQIKTGSKLPPPIKPIIIYGKILSPSGQPEGNAIVYVSAGGGSLVSETTQEDGTWAITLSSVRTKDLSSYIQIDENTTLVEISIQSGPDIVASASIYPASAKPVPDITMGKTYDFKNLSPSEIGNIPKAQINAPESATTSSSPTAPATGSGAITLENPKDGDVLQTTSPEFFGGGPPNKSITITVESDPVTSIVATDSKGNWQWTTPQKLEPGSHSVTLSWTDENGILKKITRTFTIQAQSTSSTASSEKVVTPGEIVPTPAVTGGSLLSKINTPTVIIALIIIVIVIALIISIKFFLNRKNKKIETNEITTQPQNQENQKPINGSKNIAVKILVTMGVIILVGVAGYSGLNVYKKKFQKPTNIAKQVLPSPTAILLPPTETPTPSLIALISQTPTLSPTLTLTQAPTPTEKLVTPTPTPKPTVTPTSKPSPTPTKVITSQPSPTTPIQTLPSAGFNLPTIVSLLGGVTFIIISLSLLL